MEWIVAWHQDFLITHKPAEWDFHDCHGQLGFFNSVAGKIDEPLWPVHRLDKVTSGLLLMARSAKACAELNQLFISGQISKCYLAIAEGKPKKKQGRVAGDMARARRGAWRLQRSTENPAVTRFDSFSMQPGLRGYWLFPQTGKTHQLRVAMKSLGVPILGDALYGGASSDRVYLHSYRVDFPWRGEKISHSVLPASGDLFTTAPGIEQLFYHGK